jgi:hypothetical protein
MARKESQNAIYMGGLGALKIPYGTCFGARAAEMAHLGVPYGYGRMGAWGRLLLLPATPFFCVSILKWNRVAFGAT